MASIQGAIQSTVRAANQCLELGHGHGRAEQKALPCVAVMALQKLALRLGFHALRDHAQALGTTVRAMAASLGSVSTSRTKLWSILS